MIDSFITWSLYAFENVIFIIAGKSMGALKRNVLKPMFQILAAKNIPYLYRSRPSHFLSLSCSRTLKRPHRPRRRDETMPDSQSIGCDHACCRSLCDANAALELPCQKWLTVPARRGQ